MASRIESAVVDGIEPGGRGSSRLQHRRRLWPPAAATMPNT